MNKGLAVILFAILLDAAGIGLIFPILPSLVRAVDPGDPTATTLGILLSIYAAMQFLFSPILGRLSDRYGRRPVLLVSLAGAALDYMVMAVAPSLWLLVVSRAIAGLTSANFAVGTAYITDITPPEQRAQRFGYLQAAFGIGFVVGPILGGLLGDMWLRAPFLVAAALNGANFALALFVLPESRPPGAASEKLDWTVLNPFRPLAWALSFRALLPLLWCYVIFSFVGQVYGVAWALFGQDVFAWDALTIGLSLGAWGACHALAQAFVVAPAVRFLGERGAMLLGIACDVASLVIMGFATQGWILFALNPLFALAGIGVPALQSLATRQVDADRQGELQGVMASLVSLTAIFGPLFFSWVYFLNQTTWPGAVWLAGAGVDLLAIPAMLLVPRAIRGKTAAAGQS